jgi:hypothetical protein
MLLGLTNVISVLLGSASAGGPSVVPLDGLIHIDDAYHCSVGKDFKALLSSVIRWEQIGDSYKGKSASPVVPARYRNQVGNPSLSVIGSEYRATLPMHGTWRGLPVRSLIVIEWVESESGFYLVFDATRKQVLDVANKAGFQIPKSGSEYRDGDVIGVNVGVTSVNGKAALYCIDG